MNCQDMVFPSWNRRGGCASKKKTRSLRSGADGVVIMVHVDVVTLFGTDPPSPLLSEEGNTLSCNSFTPSKPGATFKRRSAAGPFPQHQDSRRRDCNVNASSFIGRL